MEILRPQLAADIADSNATDPKSRLTDQQLDVLAQAVRPQLFEDIGTGMETLDGIDE